MNKIIIRNWNERVKPEDTVYHIGDFCFKQNKVKYLDWESKLNGTIIHIKGNHDRNNGTKSIVERIVIKFGGQRFNLVHDPEFANIHYDINLVGHVHQHWQIKRIRRGEQFTDCINVGVDAWDFRPVSIDEIIKRHKQWLKEEIHK